MSDAHEFDINTIQPLDLYEYLKENVKEDFEGYMPPEGKIHTVTPLLSNTVSTLSSSIRILPFSFTRQSSGSASRNHLSHLPWFAWLHGSLHILF